MCAAQESKFAGFLLGLKIYWSINTSCPRYARDGMSRNRTQEHKVPTFQKSIIFPSVIVSIFSPTLSSTIFHHCHNLLSSVTHPLSIPWWQTGQMEDLYRWGGSDHPYSDHQLEGRYKRKISNYQSGGSGIRSQKNHERISPCTIISSTWSTLPAEFVALHMYRPPSLWVTWDQIGNSCIA